MSFFVAEAQDIKVETYQNIAFDGAWKSRSRAMWGIAALGLLAGAAIGLLAPLFPILAVEGFASTITATHVLESMAIFGATGMATGLLAGGFTGSAAGASAAVAKEAERRDLIRTKEIEQATGIKIPEPENFKAGEPEQRLFNPKVSAMFATFGAIAGGVMATAFFASGAGISAAAIPALNILVGGATGAAATQAAITACFIGVMTCFGAMFGVNFPKIGGYLQDFAGKLLDGSTLGASWNKEPAQAIEKSTNITHTPTLPEQDCTHCATNHAEKLGERRQPIVSYKEWVVSQPAEASAALVRS